MIDLRSVWLPQIIRYAELVVGGNVLRSAWIGGDRSQISVTDYDELCEQIFGDMDAEALIDLAESDFRNDPELVRLISDFVAELQRVDRVVTDADIGKHPERILALAEWSVFQDRAHRLDVYAASRGYPRDFSDDEPTARSR